MTLCVYGNTEVTHILRGNRLEITFEQAVNGGFHTLVVWDTGEIISNDGFNLEEVRIFLDFLARNVHVMYEEARGLL